jgi:hypothetical protein
MHPSKMKSRALSAAAKAEDDGFTATADALRLLAEACAVEAREDVSATLSVGSEGRRDARQGRAARVEIVH